MTSRDDYSNHYSTSPGYLDRMKGYDAGWKACVEWFTTEIDKDGDEYRDLSFIISEAHDMSRPNVCKGCGVLMSDVEAHEFC